MNGMRGSIISTRVQRPNSAIRRMFDYISDGKLQWADMGRVYDRIIIGKEYEFVKGVENFKEKLIGYFPEEKMPSSNT